METKDYDHKELIAFLRKLGCQVKYVFFETPEKEPFPNPMALVEIQEWLRIEKGITILGQYRMFSKGHEKVSFRIVRNGRVVYDSDKWWLEEQRDKALYEGIKEAVKILKDGIGE